VVDITPLTPDVSYQVWVVGVNSRGEGLESNKITFTASSCRIHAAGVCQATGRTKR
jgi:hypothetical protein